MAPFSCHISTHRLHEGSIKHLFILLSSCDIISHVHVFTRFGCGVRGMGVAHETTSVHVEAVTPLLYQTSIYDQTTHDGVILIQHGQNSTRERESERTRCVLSDSAALQSH